MMEREEADHKFESFGMQIANLPDFIDDFSLAIIAQDFTELFNRTIFQHALHDQPAVPDNIRKTIGQIPEEFPANGQIG
jgi:hypothetical protein